MQCKVFVCKILSLEKGKIGLHINYDDVTVTKNTDFGRRGKDKTFFGVKIIR